MSALMVGPNYGPTINVKAANHRMDIVQGEA
jgi:hypothetical protein